MRTLVGPLPMHGLGGGKDLPLPPELAIAGGIAALIVSFGVLALAWRSPRYDVAAGAPVRGRAAPGWLTVMVNSPAWSIALKVLGLALFAYTVMVAMFGEDLLTNPFFGIFYIWIWVGIVPLSLLFGPFWKAISPVRTITAGLARLTGNDLNRPLYKYPEKLGYWPAALGLFAFVWMELVYPHSTELGPVRLWCAAYVAFMVVGGSIWGNTFFARADPFEVYSSLVAKVSIWGRHEGRLWVRSPLANLATIVPRPGLVAVTAVLFGSTAYDSFRETSFWVSFTQGNDTVVSSAFLSGWLNFFTLTGMCLAVGLIFVAATTATGVAPGTRRSSLPGAFAHSMVPIIVGYMVAHYLSYFYQGAVATMIKFSDPFSNGADWFGTADWNVSYWLSHHPTFLATVKVLAVVIGHILGVIAAHDRSVALLPKGHKLTGQLPLLVAMVGFTGGGLYLLFIA